MSADPAYQAWRGQKLWETSPNNNMAFSAAQVGRLIDMIAEDALNPTHRVAQPDWEALGLGSADEAAGRN